MYKGHTVGVVVPAYNEEGFVGEVIDTMPDFVDRVYVVDDQSTDGTWQEIRNHADEANRVASQRRADATIADGGLASSQRVVPIRHETNRGVGGAIKTGYRRAYRDEMDVTAVMAGDGQMDPDLLDGLLDPVVDHGADYAKGNRLLHPEFRDGMPRFRLFGNAVLSLLTKIASGYWRIGDPQNGYTAISYRALDELDVENLYEEYGFANELLVRLNECGMQVADVAVPALYGDEQSTIRYRTFVPRLSTLLLVNFCRRLRTQSTEDGDRSTVLCYVLGVLGLLATLLAGLGVLGGVAIDLDHVGVAGLVSATSLALAVLLDVERNEDLEIQVFGEAEADA
ncbi:glycosyltransferase family 2 protein [Halorussus litoreus]|uniref:glycosyltransferase family 2 protein n=1 Tax=Halorussus litoreus TaxID=1710536 RepID=UPI000E233888|nr:glycosyltransferase family 2 protein [Halorussus litoreus]